MSSKKSKKYERKSIVYSNGKWYEITYYYDKTVTVKEL